MQATLRRTFQISINTSYPPAWLPAQSGYKGQEKVSLPNQMLYQNRQKQHCECNPKVMWLLQSTKKTPEVSEPTLPYCFIYLPQFSEADYNFSWRMNKNEADYPIYSE